MRTWARFAVLALLLGPPGWARAGVKVEIDGLEGNLAKNAAAMVTLSRAKDDWPEGQIRRLHRRAPDEIQRALQPYGYYRATVEASLEPKGKNWVAHYSVTPGPVAVVGHVDVQLQGEGSADTAFVSIAQRFPVRPGTPLAHAAYEKGKKDLMRYAATKGYFEAAFDTSAIVVDVDSSRADVIVHLDTGTRFTFGEVRLNQDVIDPRQLQGYVGFKPGDPFEYDKLVEMQTALTSVPYFRDVEIKPRPDQVQGREIPIDIDLTPAKSQRYEVGAGYGTDTGIRGKLKAEFRRINRSGHYAEIAGEASELEYSGSAQYKIPWPFPHTQLLTLFGGVGRFEPDWSTSLRSMIGTSLGTNRGKWRELLSIRYEYEDFDVASESGYSSLVVLGIGYTRSKTNDRIYPTRGSRLEVNLKGAHDALFSSTSFLQARTNAKFVRGVMPRMRLIVRGDLATTYTNDFAGLPPTLRFVTGGDQTVRGYSYESLGPRNEAGQIVGGKSLVVGSVELEQRLWPAFGLAAFYDVGNGLSSFNDPLNSGVGAGLRWISPIGPLRLDGAFGLSEDGTPFRVHFAIGPDF